MSFAVPVVADSIAARAGVGAAADGMGAAAAKNTASKAAPAKPAPAKAPARATPDQVAETARKRPAKKTSTKRAAAPAPTLSPPRSLSGWSSADGGGFALGLVLFALGHAYLRYGPAGVRGWFAAKFLNRVDPTIAAAEAARGIAPKAAAK